MASNDPNTPNDPNPYALPADALDAAIPAAEVEGEAFVDFGGGLATLGEGASGVIPIAELPESPSGQSMTSWTEIIRRQREANQPDADADVIEAKPVRVDAPSDVHLLNMVNPTDSAQAIFGHSDVLSELPLPETSEIPQADLPVFGEPEHMGTDSAADLARFLPPSPLGIAGSSAVQFDVQTPPDDAGGAMPLPDLRSLSEADDGVNFETIRLPEAELMAPLPISDEPDATDDSTADIGRALPDLPPTETSRSSILDALLSDSIRAEVPLPPPAPPSEPDLDLESTDFPTPIAPSRLANLPPPTFVPPRAPMTAPSFEIPDVPTTPSRPASGWTMNIPGQESGRLLQATQEGDRDSDDAVDLYAGAAPTPSITDSGSLAISDEVIEEAQRRSQLMDSSAVDLGSRPSFHDSEFEAAFQRQQRLGNALPIADEASNPEIDLGLPVVPDDTSSSMIRNNQQDPLPSSETHALAAVFEERRRTKGQTSGTAPIPAPAASATPTAKRGGGMLVGTAAGLLIGAGSVLGMYFGGALPSKGTAAAPPTTDAAELAKAKQDALDARTAAGEAVAKADAFAANVKKSLTDAGIANPDNVDGAIQSLVAAKSTSDTTIKNLTDMANKAKADMIEAMKAATTAKEQLADATKTATTAQQQLADVTKQLDTAKEETTTAKKAATDAKKAADDSLAALTKALKDAGADAPKLEDGIKKLVEARTAAEAKEKDALAKADVAAKKEADLQKVADTAKAAEELAKKDVEAAKKSLVANETTLKTLGERLVKAKFVPDNPTPDALLKGLDDVIKVASTDATVALRDELAKARTNEGKLKTDLATAQAKEVEATKQVTTLKAEATKLMTDLAGIADKHATETKTLKEDVAKMAKALTEINAKVDDATKIAMQSRREAETATIELAKAKAENERLARELANAVTAAGNYTPTTTVKLDPQRSGERFFNDALTAFHAGKYDTAEQGFRKAIELNGTDARFHYLLGITLYVRGESKAADEAFTKGQQMEIAGRPPRKSIADVLERIQGAPRQALNAFRP